MRKLIRLTTVPLSLQYLLRGQPRHMSAFFEVLCVSSGPATDLGEVAKREGVKVREVKMTRQITPFKDLKSVWELYKLFKKEKPSIVHSHTPKAGIVGMLAARFAGVPQRLHTAAGLPLMEATGIKRLILNVVEKAIYRCATMVYPNSKGLCDFILAEAFAPRQKIKVLANGSSNGINTAYFSPVLVSEKQISALRAQHDIQPADFVFVFVGRLVSDKGINELVTAFKKLGTPHIKLLLVGHYEHELDPLALGTHAVIKDHPDIITTGFQTDVRPYFALSSALVFPSYREGFPNVVLQAGAMGLPNIVTDINGCNEIITDDFNGIIIPVKNSESIYKAMKLLLEDNRLYKKLKNNSRKCIVDKYEQQLVCEAILGEYKSLESHV